MTKKDGSADFQIVLIDALSLNPYSKNSRIHSAEQVRQIKNSMMEWGWTNPILADLSANNTVIAGHGRLMAAIDLIRDAVPIRTPSGGVIPEGKVPVIDCAGWSENQRKAYIIADNKLAENASWDVGLLKSELSDLKEDDFDLSTIGFLPAELADMLSPEAPEQKCDPDELPDTPIEPVSVPGDVWVCGDHRVMCGDATSFNDVDELLGGVNVKADMVWMDPPYLMDFTGSIGTHGEKRQRHEKIANDKMSAKDGERFLRDIAGMVKARCSGAFYITFYRLGIEWLMRACTDAGLQWRNLIIWRKNNINLSPSDYKSQYEPMLYGWSDDYIPMLYGWSDLHMFRGPRGQSDVMDVGIPSVWDIDKTKKNVLHPTVKPVALVERSINNSSLPGQTVLDLFGGSGTTLIAAHMTGRHARILELEPRYVDVICRRFHMFSGQVPVHAETGEPFPIERFSDPLPEQK